MILEELMLDLMYDIPRQQEDQGAGHYRDNGAEARSDPSRDVGEGRLSVLLHRLISTQEARGADFALRAFLFLLQAYFAVFDQPCDQRNVDAGMIPGTFSARSRSTTLQSLEARRSRDES